MPKACSLDLRRKVVEADGRGDRTQNEGADAFGIGVASVVRCGARAKEGTLASVRAARVLSRRVLDEAGEARLIARSRATPAASEIELAADLADAGMRVSRSTVNRVPKRRGLTRKIDVYQA